MSDSIKRKAAPKRHTQPASGRFVLRIAARLHAQLRREAQAQGVSLNEYCARRLAARAPGSPSDSELQAVVTRGLEQFADSLVGVVVHGSWARGEALDTSDIDVLLVTDETVRIDRDTYRAWDAAGALAVGPHPVEVHFALFPQAALAVSPLWAELAIDGTVLYERDRAVSKLLAGIRGKIAAGRLVRRVVHGQPYWTEVA